jgi:hypothetical protein
VELNWLPLRWLRRNLPGTVRVLTVEMYEDGLVVRYVVPDFELPVGGDLDKPWEVVDVAVEDDAGTEYEWAGEGGGSHGGPFRGEVWFTPAVPGDARRLIVRTESSYVELELVR